MKANSILRQEAYQSLEGNWTRYVVVTFAFLFITIAVTSIPDLCTLGQTEQSTGMIVLGFVLSLLVLPLSWSYEVLYLHKSKEHAEGVSIGNLFDGYKDFGRVFGTILLMNIYVVLWTFLLIVPGIIKQISYTLTPFILKDRPDLSYNQAIEESMRLMKGHKMDFFLLALSMIGWVILCLLTLGIGFLWFMPYWQMIKAKFYESRMADED